MSLHLLAVALFIATPTIARDGTAIDTDVCNLVAHPKQFNHRKVRVRARIIKGMHGSALIDERCKRGVALWFAKDAQNHEDFQNLDDILIHHGNVGTSDKTIIGTFTGKPLGKKKVMHKSKLVFEAEKVEDLDVTYDNPLGR